MGMKRTQITQEVLRAPQSERGVITMRCARMATPEKESGDTRRTTGRLLYIRRLESTDHLV
jgi:hypothetical protein